MRKPPTGEPYAGKPHVRFGGRGGETLPDPYQTRLPRSLCSLAMTAVGLAPGDDPRLAQKKIVLPEDVIDVQKI